MMLRRTGAVRMFYGEPDMPLRRYAAGKSAARVRFCCAACGSGHDVLASEVIWLLKALQQGDEQTSLADSARVMDQACVRCGGLRWEAWPAPAG
jgi:hypothetical protein